MAENNAQIFTANDFRLQNGEIFPNSEIVYETYGSPPNAKENTILLLHGYTSSPHAAGGGASNPGWWESLIGPGDRQ